MNSTARDRFSWNAGGLAGAALGAGVWMPVAALASDWPAVGTVAAFLGASHLNLMENIATKPGGFAKLFGKNCWPSAQIDHSFVENLVVPNSSKPMDYPELFEKARTNIIQGWTELGQALADDDPAKFTLANANLDTGRDVDDKYVYWS